MTALAASGAEGEAWTGAGWPCRPRRASVLGWGPSRQKEPGPPRVAGVLSLRVSCSQHRMGRAGARPGRFWKQSRLAMSSSASSGCFLASQWGLHLLSQGPDPDPLPWLGPRLPSTPPRTRGRAGPQGVIAHLPAWREELRAGHRAPGGSPPTSGAGPDPGEEALADSALGAGHLSLGGCCPRLCGLSRCPQPSGPHSSWRPGSSPPNGGEGTLVHGTPVRWQQPSGERETLCGAWAEVSGAWVLFGLREGWGWEGRGGGKREKVGGEEMDGREGDRKRKGEGGKMEENEREGLGRRWMGGREGREKIG